MKRREFLKSSLRLGAVCLLPGCLNNQKISGTQKRPNIIFIIADDLGWADVGYHDSEILTPNIDSLASTGVRLNQHYVMPTCSPTRCGLLSGRYPSRFGVLAPTNDCVFERGQVTLASALKRQGYATNIVGKWHLGSSPQWGPLHYGFDHAYGSLAGGCTPYTHKYKKGQFTDTWHRDHKLIEEQGHVTDLLGSEAVAVIRDAAKTDQPFFLYVPFTAPHVPIVEPEKYTQIYDGKIENISRKSYAACVTHMDEMIGDILRTLEQTNQLDNTLIIFTSDNGGSPPGKYADQYPLEYGRPYADFDQLGKNQPLRSGKMQLYEGGIRVPAVVSWPGTLLPCTVDSPVHIVDWLATLSGIAGYNDLKSLKLDGRNIWPVISGKQKNPSQRTLYWHSNAQWAIRKGNWKLIVDKDKTQTTQLFNLAADPCEQQDLSETNPQMVKQLNHLMEQFKKDDAPKMLKL